MSKDTEATGDATDETIGYAAAVDELEAILAVLERDDLDIDTLGPQVQRAASLIRVCRDRIASARHDVEQIVADLDRLDGATTTPSPEPNPDRDRDRDRD